MQAEDLSPPIALLYTTRQYPCGCMAEGVGDVPAYCAEHGVCPATEEPVFLRLRNGFQVDINGNEEPLYGEYVLRKDYDALRVTLSDIRTAWLTDDPDAIRLAASKIFTV